MGRDKSQLLYRTEQTFLQRALARANQVCRAVCIAPGENQIDAGGTVTIADTICNAGPAAAIAGALAEALHRQLEGCLVTPIDMPDLAEEELQRLIRVWQNDPTKIACVVCTTNEEKRLQPLVAIYPTIFQKRLTDLAASEHRSLYKWLATQDIQTVELPPSACRNINRPDQYDEQS